MSSSTEFSTEQLAAARATSWHQSATPLVSLDGLRDYLTASGILLFTPRPLQLPVPAPSLVEAMLGAASVGPTDGQIAAARSIVARLVAEGNALPLNLFGIPGDLPDFVVSAQVFSFVYTLGGDKAWKLPPASASPLGLRIYEILAEKGALSAAELASEVGRETTESAIQRSLTELWSNLRVLPLLSQNADGPTLWELTTRRFTKAIKAGINAGQPTALSALISLYLAQALLATEDEIETFLSPLAARSRIREVANALSSSRQLETIVLEGKSLLVIPGTLPEFPEIEKPEPTEEELAAASAAALSGEGNIKKFSSSSERRAFGDFKGKPARVFGTKPAFTVSGGTRPTARFGAKPAFGSKPAFGAKAAFGSKPYGAKPEGERRPFRRDADAKPSFTKPWAEKPRAEGAEGEAPKRPYTPRAANAGSSFARKPYAPREGGSSFAKKPYAPREGGSSTFPKRPYTPREEGAEGEAKRPYAPRAANAGSTFPKRPYAPREGGGANTGSYGAKRPFTPREGGGGDSFERPARPSFGAKRSFGDKPAFRKPFASSEGGDAKPYARKAYPPRDGGSSDRSSRPSFGAKGAFGDRGNKPSFGDRGAKSPYTRPTFSDGGESKPAGEGFQKFRKFDAPKFDRPARPMGGRPDKPAYGGSNSKPRAPKEEKFQPYEASERAGNPKRPFPRKEGDLADRPVRPWPEKTGRSDGRPGGPGSKPRGPRKDYGDRDSKPRGSFGGDRDSKPRGSFGDKPRGKFGSKPSGGGFSKRSSSDGDKVFSGVKAPANRRGTPGEKPSFPRKPRSEE